MSDLFNSINPTLPFGLPDKPGYSAVWSEELNGYKILVPNGELFYIEKFFDEKICNRTIEYFQENSDFDWRTLDWRSMDITTFETLGFLNIKWKQDQIKMFGKNIPLPRITSWYGDGGKSYTYSGIKSYPNNWNKGLLYIKDRVEQLSNSHFNSVLINWYRDGMDHLSWHADDEKELGRNPTIASVNFGETRDFIIRRNDDASAKIKILLKNGTLLVMRGELQHFWQHSVPKRKGVNGSRFNLTFRRIGE